MNYHQADTSRNGNYLLDQSEIQYRRQPSLACRLFATRFGLCIETAMSIARVASFPQLEEV
jgi:hypothetical protein